jgi:hypothetical protein
MMKYTLVLFLLFAGFTLSAQEVISTQGDSYINGNGSIDFTIGEVIIDTGTDGSIFLTQGFHQITQGCIGDFNSDGEINISDLLFLLAESGCTGTCGADLNQNGSVGADDLLIFLSLFGTSCT